MTGTPEYYESVLDSFHDLESCTVVIAAGLSRNEAAAALGVDLGTTLDEDDPAYFVSLTGWALMEIDQDVLGIEHTGYGEPSLISLKELSSGGAAAVLRSNIDGDMRFGCARAGAVWFDDNEYPYIGDLSAVPGELRRLYDLVYDDLEGEITEETPEGPSPWAVGLAMAEIVTGIALTRASVDASYGVPLHPGPMMAYAPEE